MLMLHVDLCCVFKKIYTHLKYHPSNPQTLLHTNMIRSFEKKNDPMHQKEITLFIRLPFGRPWT